jgi:hypothetical protein
MASKQRNDDQQKPGQDKPDRPDPMKAVNTTFTPPEADLEAPPSDVEATPHEKVDIGGTDHTYKRAGQQATGADQPDERRGKPQDDRGKSPSGPSGPKP